MSREGHEGSTIRRDGPNVYKSRRVNVFGYRRDREKWAHWLSAVAVALFSVAVAPAQTVAAEPFEATAELDAKELRPGQTAKIQVNISIADKHYLYADQTSVTPVPVAGLSFGEVEAPTGKKKQDPYLGMVTIYQRRATFVLPVTADLGAERGNRSIALDVAYQGCTADACFPPKKERLTIEVAVLGQLGQATTVALDELDGGSRPVSPPVPCTVTASAVPARVAPGHSFAVEVTFGLARGHHLDAGQTTIAAATSPGLSLGAVSAPKSIPKQDPYLGVVQLYEGRPLFRLPVSVDRAAALGPRTITITATYLACTDTSCFPPRSERLLVVVAVVSEAAAQSSTAGTASGASSVARRSNKADVLRDVESRFGRFGILVLAFAWGVAASLTPCVYPMIPVTMTVIGASSAGSAVRGFFLSLVYVLGLSLVYAVFGVVAAWSGGMFGQYAQHSAVRLTVAAIFGLLAMSMFDVFYIQVPSSITSKLAGSKGAGVVGAFLTGAAGGAVVGPCVGPLLVGLLVYIAALGDKVMGFLTMWSFALGMGVLFLVVGTASGAATALPKAGAWMEKVKHAFGLVLLGFALYFGRPAVSPEVFALLLGCTLIVVGVLGRALDRLGADATGRDRLAKAAALICLVLGIGYTATFVLGDRALPPQKPAGTAKASGVQWLHDEAAGLAKAKQEGKPVLLDFGAAWCPPCRKMEAVTFVDPAVVAESRRFVCIEIDCTDPDNTAVAALMTKYQVSGVPALAFVDSEGRFDPNRSLSGFVSPSEMVDHLSKIE